MTKKSSMKKILVFVLALVVILALSACIRYEAKMTVSADRKMNITLLYAEYSEMGSDNDSKAKVDAMAANGWTVTDYSDKEYSGWEMAKQGISFDDLVQELKATGFGFSNFSLEEQDDVYTLTWDFSDSLQTGSTKASDLSTIGNLGGVMRFYISLPQPAIEQNATTVNANGARLEWDMLKLSEPIMVKFSLDGAYGQGTVGTDDNADPSGVTDASGDPAEDPADASGDPIPTDSGRASRIRKDIEAEADEHVFEFVKGMSKMTLQWILIVLSAIVALLLIAIVVLIILLVKTAKKKDIASQAMMKTNAPAPTVAAASSVSYPSLPNPFGQGGRN